MALFDIDPDPEPPKPHPRSDEYRLVALYEQLIRPCAPFDRTVAMRNLKLMQQKGMTLEQVETAIRNYADDPWRRAGGSRLSKNIKSFFAEAIIKEWQTPVVLPDRHPLAGLSVETAHRPTTDRFTPVEHEEPHEEL